MQLREDAAGSFLEGISPSSLEGGTNHGVFCFHGRAVSFIGGRRFLCVLIGAVVLTTEDRPAIRAVLWEGLPTLSESVAKPPAKNQERRTRKRSSGGDVGNALRAAYNDALKEDIPPDLLALLGKLD